MPLNRFIGLPGRYSRTKDDNKNREYNNNKQVKETPDESEKDEEAA